jgi:site-specific DNA-methyltransferase (adenine-specific)
MEINTVIQGDCLEVMKEIESGSIDMILCDLPYGTTACKWDVIIPFDKLWEQYKRIIKSNGAIVLTASQPFTSALVMSNPKMFKYEIIWVKDKPSNIFFRNVQPLKYHENILVFSLGDSHNMSKKNMIYNPQMEKRDEKNKRNNKDRINKNNGIFGDRIFNNKNSSGANEFIFPKSIQKYNTPRKTIHETQKPVALFEYLIKTYTNENELVLDNCAGSGTTGEACLRTNRNYILIEKEQKYVDIARERIQQFKNSQTNSLFNL